MFDLIKYKYISFIISGVLMGASALALLVYGLKPGIDFTGGSLMEVSFSKERPSIEQIHEALKDANLGTTLVQPIDSDSMLVKTRFITEDEHQTILTSLRQAFEKGENKVFEDRLETIGPAISAHLRNRALGAGILVLVAIVLYIAYTFRKVSQPLQSWKYGLVAIFTLIHDVGITAGVFALLGKFHGVEVDIPFVVALLTILGYSVNDTIVVFDRIRENLMKRGSGNFADTVNRGINETWTRSLNTSLSILLVLLALFFFGGASIHYFSLALIIGTIVGSYSSIFLASPLLVVWDNLSRKRI
ncbi:MAG TPA: protein translocase subunit SecF [Candidatus Kapabacteria bacterium]|nr:protein translocase subunit SecF [Candidatus Kapabacteria bacterium]